MCTDHYLPSVCCSSHLFRENPGPAEYPELIYHMYVVNREDQADEYSSLRRELEQTIKNCRVLSFKLKKTERRAEQLEHEKADQDKKLLEVTSRLRVGYNNPDTSLKMMISLT